MVSFEILKFPCQALRAYSCFRNPEKGSFVCQEDGISRIDYYIYMYIYEAYSIPLYKYKDTTLPCLYISMIILFYHEAVSYGTSTTCITKKFKSPETKILLLKEV